MSNVNEYGCLMLRTFLPETIKNKLPEIDLDDVSDDGIEKQHHITLLYGLHESVSWKECKNKLENFDPISDVKLTNITFFDNDDADVLICEVESETLHKMNKKLKTLPHQETFPEYKPHMTIAYLKKGCGEKYTREINISFKKLDTLIYSEVDGTKIYWFLK